MTANDILVQARQYAGADSNSLTDTLGLAFANDALEEFHSDLIDRDIDASQVQEAYFSVTSGVGTYTYPTDMFALKTIEINTQDTQSTNYIQVQQVDIANLQGQTSPDFLRANQPIGQPIFDDRGDYFELFPTPTTGIVKIFYFLKPTEYTLTTSTLAYPVTLDYRCLAAKTAQLYLESLERFDASAVLEKKYASKLNKLVRILGKGSQQPIEPQILQITGFEY